MRLAGIGSEEGDEFNCDEANGEETSWGGVHTRTSSWDKLRRTRRGRLRGVRPAAGRHGRVRQGEERYSEMRPVDE